MVFKVSEREWLKQLLKPPNLVDSEAIHWEGSNYDHHPEDVSAWDVMADICSHLQAADTEQPLLPLLNPDYLLYAGSLAMTSFVCTVTRCLSSLMLAILSVPIKFYC